MELFIEVEGEHGRRPVIGQPLEKRGEVRDPKRGLKLRADRLDALPKNHARLPRVSSAASA